MAPSNIALTHQQTGSQRLRLLQSDLFAALFSKLATRNAMLYSAYFRRQLEKLPLLPVDSDAMQILHQANQFKQRILALIAQAERRIYLVALYLQDDEAGREIMQALYAAKQARPQLDIKVFVDFHRAQRGLIGKGAQSGNHLMYQEFASQYPACDIPFYGVPVKRREWLGVLHLKGFLFDNTLLYSGASLNNVYLHQQDRYRFDRYHQIQNADLADSFARLILRHFVNDAAIPRLDKNPIPNIKQIKSEQRRFRRRLQAGGYEFEESVIGPRQFGVTPLIGLGKRGNKLNRVIRDLVRSASQEIFICTPYFNPPSSLARDISGLLQRKVKVTIVVGDKTANDFYIPPSEPFKTVGGLPYLYEINLRRFANRYQNYIDNGQLNIMLWQHEQHSYHLKGIFVDDQLSLITGSNLNPRAWALDLENGMLLRDPHRLLCERFDAERANILQHTRRLTHYSELEQLQDYPDAVKRLLTRIQRFKAHILLKQIL
jgi:CDP-diacylglycerol--serine O-phosphatidyltransferase